MATLPPTSHETPTVASTRSTFITVLAWLSILLAGGGTLIAVMQAVVFFLFMRDQLSVHTRSWPGQEQLPAIVQFLFSHPELYFAIFWSLTVLTLVAGVGLLYRKNWARIYFIAVLAFGIIWQIGGLWLQRQVLGMVPSAMRDASSNFAKEFAVAETVISIGSTVFAAALIVLFAWLIKRLTSRIVRAEFHAL